MATETGDRLSSHLRGVTVTTVATILGVGAGVGAAAVASGPGDTIGLVLLAGAIVAQLPVLSVLGVDIDDFSKKDHIYVIFMTFVLWFISWGLLLTAGALQ